MIKSAVCILAVSYIFNIDEDIAVLFRYLFFLVIKHRSYIKALQMDELGFAAVKQIS